MTHKEAMEIAKEVERIHLDSNCSFNEAIAKVKEMISNENIKKMEKAN